MPKLRENARRSHGGFLGSVVVEVVAAVVVVVAFVAAGTDNFNSTSSDDCVQEPHDSTTGDAPSSPYNPVLTLEGATICGGALFLPCAAPSCC